MSENEEKEPKTEIDIDLSTLTPAIKTDAFHDWRQQGPLLVCKSCDIQHGSYVGINVRLTGILDGKPQFTKVK